MWAALPNCSSICTVARSQRGSRQRSKTAPQSSGLPITLSSDLPASAEAESESGGAGGKRLRPQVWRQQLESALQTAQQLLDQMLVYADLVHLVGTNLLHNIILQCLVSTRLQYICSTSEVHDCTNTNETTNWSGPSIYSQVLIIALQAAHRSRRERRPPTPRHLLLLESSSRRRPSEARQSSRAPPGSCRSSRVSCARCSRRARNTRSSSRSRGCSRCLRAYSPYRSLLRPLAHRQRSTSTAQTAPHRPLFHLRFAIINALTTRVIRAFLYNLHFRFCDNDFHLLFVVAESATRPIL